MTQVIILTGAIQTGKTTALQEWLKNKDARGILSPVVNGLRSLYAIQERIYIPFESIERTAGTISIGRYHFYQKAFDQANYLLLSKMITGWCIIDEVGPLELQEQGFFPALEKLRKNSKHNLLVVVRSSLLATVQEKFEWQHARIITADDLGTLKA